ncbi:MAG TPA: tetratricopeptide repeat protein [Opitutaceae bacterium]|nr:tetratricopeptide repeat protein [Opitutaceae bacterium]
MNRRALRALIGLVLGGLAAAGYLWWRAGERRAIVVASVPQRPDLNALPPEMAQRVGACERRAQAGPDRIAALGELSCLYHANGFFAEASQCYQGLLRVDAGDPHWLYRLATIIAGYGQLDDALPLWRRAVKLAPDYVPAHLRLGDTLLKTNQNTQAAKVYAAVLERDPRNPYALLGLARIDLDAGRWEAARERLEVVVQQSNYGIGYDLLPTVYEHLGETARAEAIRARNKASGAFYDVPDPWIDELVYDCYDTYRISAAAGTADHAGDPRAAIRILERALTLAPDKAVFQFQMGGFYLELNDLGNAHRYFERCTELAPDFADGWAQLTVLLMKLGNLDASERALDAGLANCPNSPGLHFERGRRLSEAGLYPDAIREFERTIRLRPQEADGYVSLAGVYFKLDRVDEGVAELRRSLQFEPGNPVALSTLAFHAISVGDEAGAREWLRHIQQQPRISSDTRDGLVQAFRQKFGRSPD